MAFPDLSYMDKPLSYADSLSQFGANNSISNNIPGLNLGSLGDKAGGFDMSSGDIFKSLNALSNIYGALMGGKQLGLAKEQLGLQKSAYETDVTNQIAGIRGQVGETQDILRQAEIASGRDPSKVLSTADKMAQLGFTGSV